MARKFNGSTDRLTVGSGGITVSIGISMFILVKPYYNGAQQTFIMAGRGSNAGDGYGLSINASGFLLINEDFVVNNTSNLHIDFGKWNGVALVRRAIDSRWISFVNGRKTATGINTNNPFGPTSDYSVGASKRDDTGAIASPLLGYAAEAAYWSAELTDQELFRLTTRKVFPANIRRSKLLNYHPMRGNNPEVPSIAGATLTLTGTAKAAHPTLLRSSFVNRLGRSMLA